MKTLTTESGASVADNQHSQTVGAAGPTLLQDQHLIEKLARLNRERIPERVVHATGTGCYGYFEVTSAEAKQLTCMKMFSEVGKRTDAFVRFSTVAGSKGSPDSIRDPRGFAMKFYTEDGNWDLVGNNTPVFFLRDGIKFPDFLHSQKYDPFTNRREPNNIFDFFSYTPEATHQFTWLFGDRGLPKSYRCMDGFGSHTFAWVNAAGERVWVKFHLKTDQGIACRSQEEAEAVGGHDAEAMQHEFYQSVQAKKFPSWTLKVQIMSLEAAAKARVDPFDVTKVWSHKDFPLRTMGKLVLDRLPDNYFEHTEQAAFSPTNFVEGVGPSPDRMLQARLFAYADAQRYRLGVNHTRLEVNRARGLPQGAQNYGRDGLMASQGNGGAGVNYHPNSASGPDQTGAPDHLGYEVAGGRVGNYPPPVYPDTNDFSQAGDLFRLIGKTGGPGAQQRLIDSLSEPLSQVTRPGVVDRILGFLTQADPAYGSGVAKKVAELRGA
jgi:catalase